MLVLALALTLLAGCGIMKEYLSNIYLKMVMYKDFYSDSEIAEMEEISFRITRQS